jgi:HEPN domain-containing protein
MNNKQINYWLDLAEYDYETAKVMLKSKRFLYVGFMCHQVVEKSLKALYVKNSNQTPPYTHNLSVLSNKNDIYKKLNDSQKDLIDLLEPLNIETRYPKHKKDLLESLNFDKCKEIIDKTGDLFKWIKKLL